MVKIIKICMISLFLLGCRKQYNYKIVGSVMVNDTLNAIKVQDIKDEFGWIVEAK